MFDKVPASAIGKPSAALVATALWILTLHHVMKGTETKPPPAPTKPDKMPITPPAANMPRGPGSSRDAAGFLSSRLLGAEIATNPAKNIANPAEFSCLPIHGPIHEPIRMPGASTFTICHDRSEERRVGKECRSRW